MKNDQGDHHLDDHHLDDHLDHPPTCSGGCAGPRWGLKLSRQLNILAWSSRKI